MGLLDQLTQMLGGKKSNAQADNSPLLAMAMSLLQKQGGVGGLLQQFQQNGLGELASSWVGTGSNQSINQDQLRSALGDKQLSELAKANGLSKQDAASGLTELLPQLIDKMTPDGQAKTGDDLLQKGISVLGQLLR